MDRSVSAAVYSTPRESGVSSIETIYKDAVWSLTRCRRRKQLWFVLILWLVTGANTGLIIVSVCLEICLNVIFKQKGGSITRKTKLNEWEIHTSSKFVVRYNEVAGCWQKVQGVGRFYPPYTVILNVWPRNVGQGEGLTPKNGMFSFIVHTYVFFFTVMCQ